MKKLIILFLLIPLLAFGKEDFLALQGKVLDAETGEPLRGATVQVLETPRGTFTDPKGYFRITNLKPSRYSLKVSYIGYQTKIIKEIENQNEELNITLIPEVKATQEVIIEASKVMDNESAILTRRKNSAQVSDGISIEEIKKLPDGNIGSTLKRLPGITMVNDFIVVRGMNERYNNAALDGSLLPSTEADKKAFSFDLYPSEFIENVNIVKSYTPDIPGNFAGGLVLLNSTDFPAGKIFKVSIGTSSNTNTTFKSNAFQTYSGGATDWLGFDDGTRQLPSDFPKNRLEFNNLQISANNPFDTTNAKERYESVMKSFSNKTLKQINKTITPLDDKKINLFFANTFDISNVTLGITAIGTYNTNQLVSNIERNTFLSNFDPIYVTSGNQSTREVQLSGLFNLALKINSSNIITLKNSFNNTAQDELLILNGKDVGYQFLEFKNFSFHYTQKSLFYSTLHGVHYFGTNDMLLDWSLACSELKRDEPDYRRFRFSRQLADLEYDPNTPFLVELLSNQQGDGTRAGRFYSNLYEKTLNPSINYSITIFSIKFKIGSLAESRKRSFNARSITLTASPALREDLYNLMSDYRNIDKIFDPDNFNYDDGFRIGEDSKLSDSYSANETLLAGYGMFDIPVKLISIPFRIIGGVRIENNTIELNSFSINDEPVNIKYRTNDLLPSLNIIANTSKESNIRFAFSRTVARPSFREFAPFAFYDYYNLSLVQGNPNLKRSLINNIDLRYEMFPTLNEVYSISFFYKTFENAIEETIYPQQSELTRTFGNADGTARNYGIELEFRKNLGFLSSILKDFSLNGNLALIKSQITIKQGGKGTEDTRPMWGQSPYTFNLNLFYQNYESGTIATLSYNTFGKRIAQVSQVGIYQTDNPHIYELPTHHLDFSLTQKLLNFQLKFGIRNILGTKTIWEQNGKRWASNFHGSTIIFSITYNIF